MRSEEGQCCCPFTDVLKPFLQGNSRTERANQMSNRKMADYPHVPPCAANHIEELFVDHIPDVKSRIKPDQVKWSGVQE
jgi:hypothetical protein